MNLHQVLLAASIVLILTGAGVAAEDAQPSVDSPFEPPIRLMADGLVIDTGPAWGHSSPAVFDVNGDGLKDLVVGDFSGKFRCYTNTGKPNAPAYSKGALVQAGGADAEVHIYCCIGSQPRFHDLDGDGIRDMLANSYDPGHAYLFRGLPGNRFAAREEMLDKASVPIRSSPVQKQNYQSFGSFFEAVDWDADGDLDLLIGCFSGELKLRVNEGTAKSASFATENIAVEAAGEPLRVKAHLCPVVADWDGDGLWDIVAGSDDGSVTWFRNVGSKTSPTFKAGQTLVPAHDGTGYSRVIWSEEDIVPGIRSQVEVTDYNGDGRLDLLVGDFYHAYEFKKNLSVEQKQEINKLIAEQRELGKPLREKWEALQKDFAERYPGDESFSEQAVKEWDEAYKAYHESAEKMQSKERGKLIREKLRPFSADSAVDADDLENAHGHVWLFIRK